LGSLHVVRVDVGIEILMIACSGQRTHFEYVWYFAYKVFDKMPQWKLYWLFSWFGLWKWC